MPENNRIKVGVIGVGQIGKMHLTNYGKMPNVEVAAVADVNPTELARAADLFGVPDTYADFRKLLERPDIAALDICLHNNLHMRAAVEALQAGKHVFCEKPMAGSYVNAATMLSAAAESGRMLSIQNVQYFEPQIKAAKALVDGGRLGRIYHARSVGHRRRGRPYVDGYGSPAFVRKETAGGGALYDMGVYHISTMLYLLGNPEILRVSGAAYQELPMNDERRESSGFDVEELGIGLVRLEGNVTLDIIEAWAAHIEGMGGSIVLGSEGGIRLDPFRYFQSIGELDLSATADLDAFNFRLHNVLEQGNAYDSPQHHWIAALNGETTLLPTAEIALNCMLISEGIYLSARKGREVSADEIRAESVSSAIEF